MKRILKITGIVILILIVALAAFLGYAYYKIKNIKDTHDLQDRVTALCDNYIQKRKSPGLCVGIIQGDRIWIQGFGTIDKEKNILPDSNTFFEIGSLSKIFTASMTQLLVDGQQISWNDNIIKYLPVEVKLPVDDNTTLANLATHTSGYPRVPKAWFPKIEANVCDPYSGLNTQDLYNYLRKGEEKKKPDLKKSDYSNLGMGLLGHILEWKTGKPYDTLLQELICRPLQMNHTTTGAVNDTLFATPYDEKGTRTCHWTLPIIPGAGAIRSDMTDMLKFLQANIDNSSPLNSSFIKTHKQQVKIPTGAIGYGWHIDKVGGIFFGIPEIVWHNGGTGGFRTYMAFVPGSNRGVVVWANQANDELDGLAIEIMIKSKLVSLK